MYDDTREILQEMVEAGALTRFVELPSGKVRLWSHGFAPPFDLLERGGLAGSECNEDLDVAALLPKEDIPLALLTGTLKHHQGGEIQYGLRSMFWNHVLKRMLLHRLLR